MFKKKTLFDNVPAIEAKQIIFDMIDDFMVIVNNDNLSQSIKECFGDLKIPEGKTPKQYFDEINGNAMIANFLKSVMNYAYEPMLRILAKVFCAPYEKYSRKTINQISKDLLRFSKSPFFAFFTSAVMSVKVR